MVNGIAALQAAGSIPSGCSGYLMLARMIMILKGSHLTSWGFCPFGNTMGYTHG